MALPHRPLGKTGVQVPIIGYGTAPLGKIKVMDAGPLNKSVRLLNHAIDQGITQPAQAGRGDEVAAQRGVSGNQDQQA
jgi:predicted aldo/keto reductase-like oxidoreductase